MKLGELNVGEANLQCPACGGDYLHHHKVEVFDRKPDAEVGLHVVVEGEGATVDTDIQGNPSSRRHGLMIHFWCETCDNRSVLSVVQHKGTTFLSLDVKAKKSDEAKPTSH